MLDVASIWTANVQQRNYRAILDAMSRPGLVKPVFWRDQNRDVVIAVLATLLDSEVSLCDYDRLLLTEHWPLLQARQAPADAADYVLCDGGKFQDFQPRLGTLSSPEHATTLILKVDQLAKGDQVLSLSGPGVNATLTCSIAGLHPDWLKHREDWVCAFPLGIDLLLVDHAGVVALPRTTKVVVN
jgi:alpha-D-ribose 1-methylphosphonate 5-triphosphate synthase subunit PhnH